MNASSSLSRWLLAGLAIVTAPIAHAEIVAPAFSIPAKQIDVMGLKYLKISKRLFLPTVSLEVMNWGKITAVTQTSALQTLGGASNSTSRATMEVAVPSDIAALRAIAGELHEDLATKLKAAGWQIITYDEAKTHAVIAAAKQEEIDEKLGAPIRKVNLGKQKMQYTIASPVGMPVFEYGLLMPFWGLKSALKDLDATGLDVTYRFDPVALQGKSRHGIGSNTASTSAEANLILTHAKAFFLNSKWASGNIHLKSGVPVAGGVGDVKKASDVSPEIANGISEALSFLGGGSINSKKGLYVCELDPVALKTNLLIAGKTFNDEVVKAFGPAPATP